VRAQTRSKESDRASARQRRADRMAESKLNRAQLRAMEIRAAETLSADAEAAAVSNVAGAGGSGGPISLPRRAAALTRRAIARPMVLSKEQEYRFIRTDLRRLILTAGSLFVLMVALLFIVD
jgi:hypothetical protein